MARISIDNLTFNYDGSFSPVFEKASFQIDSAWKLGLVGRNGRGKTTLLRLMHGDFPYQGSIDAPMQFDYFPFPVQDTGRVTRDILYDLVDANEQWCVERELSLLNIPESVSGRPFCTLSQGEQTKVLLATMFARENRFLLIDEPTHHLDMDGRAQVSKYLNKKQGYILVSHDRAFLDGCIDHVLSINKATIEVQRGNFSSWQHNKQMQDDFERAENEKLKKDIGHLTEAARRTGAWSDRIEATKIGSHAADRGAIGAQAARMMKRSKAIEKRRNDAVEEKKGLLKNIEQVDDLKLFPLSHPADALVTYSNVSIAYPATDGELETIVQDFSLIVKNGDRIALNGPNGCGKSSIIKLLTGDIAPSAGTVKTASNLILSYVPQSANLQGDMRDYISHAQIDETLFKTILRKFDFSREHFEKDMSTYSAGQKKKVLLARSLCEKAHLYIWDEPLNYIDVLSRIQLEGLLLAFTPSMIFVEHDRTFTDTIATKVITMERAGRTR